MVCGSLSFGGGAGVVLHAHGLGTLTLLLPGVACNGRWGGPVWAPGDPMVPQKPQHTGALQWPGVCTYRTVVYVPQC